MIRGWLILLGSGLAAAAVAWALAMLLLKLLLRRSHSAYIAQSKQRFQHSFAAFFGVLAMFYTLPESGLPRSLQTPLRHAILVSLFGTLAWVAIKVIRIIEVALLDKYPVEHLPKSPHARRLRTLIQVIRRVLSVAIVMTAIGFALTVFAPVRVVGSSLIASAGVASIVLGIAAQGTLGQVFAGLQLAFTDALRVNDVIVLEGEWGHVENVNLTHVIMRSWDERRIILPTTYFTTKPYQNWTRYEPRVLGTVDLQLDFTADLDELREVVQRTLEANENWDGRYWVLEMTEVSASTITVRLTASADNGPKVWWLRVQVREALYKWLRDNHPQWLPRGRSAYQP